MLRRNTIRVGVAAGTDGGTHSIIEDRDVTGLKQLHPSDISAADGEPNCGERQGTRNLISARRPRSRLSPAAADIIVIGQKSGSVGARSRQEGEIVWNIRPGGASASAASSGAPRSTASRVFPVADTGEQNAGRPLRGESSANGRKRVVCRARHAQVRCAETASATQLNPRRSPQSLGVVLGVVRRRIRAFSTKDGSVLWAFRHERTASL